MINLKQKIFALIVITAFGSVGIYLINNSKATENVVGIDDSIVCNGINVNPGTTAAQSANNIQDAISSNPSGSTFCLESGTYRITNKIDPKANTTIIGKAGAVINGAKLLDNTWVKEGDYWVTSGTLPADYSIDTGPVECEDNVNSPCKKSEWVFINDIMLQKSSNLSSISANQFYLDYSNNKIYIGQDPSGKVIELSYVRNFTNSGAANVTIKNLVVEKFAPVHQHGAIEMNNGSTATNWIIENCEIRYNTGGAGMKIYSNGAIVSNNKIHHNGQTGLAVYLSDSVDVRYNELFENNSSGWMYNDGENGGMKLARVTNSQVHHNYVHHNKGLGVWFDIDNQYNQISDNFISYNYADGIRYEISFDAEIFNNIVVKNGLNRGRNATNGSLGYGGAITATMAVNVNIYDNVLYDNDKHISMYRGSNRSGSSNIPGLSWDLLNVKAYNNDITITGGLNGLQQNVSDNSYYTSKGNGFCGNKYHLADINGNYYFWNNGVNNKTQWQSAGNDKTDLTGFCQASASYDSNIPTEPVYSVSITDDTTPPEVSITNLSDGDAVSGNFNIIVSVSDESPIDSSTVYFNGNSGVTDDTAPFDGFYVNSNGFPDGELSLQVKAIDSAGNEGTSQAMTVIVANGTTISSSDLDSNGSIDIVDLSILLSSWGSSSQASDINSDGVVDIIDLSILLSNWS